MYNLIDSEPINNQFGSFGYGFPVGSDVKDWVCIGNISLGHVPYMGDLTKSLPWPNAPPGPFVYGDNSPSVAFTSSSSVFINDRDSYRGKVILQSGFMGQSGRISSLISIEPGDSRVLNYRPGQLLLESGQSITLAEISLAFDKDNRIRIRHRGNGLVLWEASSHATSPGQSLQYTETGKLVISSTQGLLHDLTPHINLKIEGSSLVISSINPYLTISGPKSSLLFASAYIFPQNRIFQLGQVISRTYKDRTLIYALSPYCQFVVLRSRQPNLPVPPLPLAWPDKEREPQWEWEVVWTTPKPPTERRNDVVMSFQGDGNLVSIQILPLLQPHSPYVLQVIYSNKTVPWASGTHGRSPPATYLRLGFGSAAEPWLELITDEGHRVWSS